MDRNELVIFVRVVQAGSIRAAAEQLGMPKSTVSRKLIELEERLEARLIQRTTRKLGLTDIGRIYYDHGARIVTDIESAERAVRSQHETPRGLLRVTAPLNIAFLGPIISTYLARYPEVRLELSANARVVDLIEEGFDVAVRVGVPNDRSLVARRLGVQQIITVAPPALVASRRLETVGDLLGLPAVNFVSPNSNRQRPWTFSSGRRQLEWVPPQPVLLDDGDGVVAAAASGLGITQAPTYLCSDALARGQLVEVLPALRPAAEPLFAVFPSRRDVPARVRAFVDFLVEAFGASSAGRERAEHGEGPE